MNLELFPPPAATETVPEIDIEDWFRDRSLARLVKLWPRPSYDSFSPPAIGWKSHPWLKYTGELQNFFANGDRGTFRQWGPNYTADPIVIYDQDVLLIKRGDNGQWGLPGGFVNRYSPDCYEPADQAGRRECLEETNIKIPEEIAGTVIYQGPVADVRMRRHAWPETTALVYILQNQPQQEPIGQDDAVQAAWFPLEIARQSDLYGSHQLLIALACAHLAKP